MEISTHINFLENLSIFSSLRRRRKTTGTIYLRFSFSDFYFVSFIYFFLLIFFFFYVYLRLWLIRERYFPRQRHSTQKIGRHTHLMFYRQETVSAVYFSLYFFFVLFDVIRFIYSSVLDSYTYHFREKLFINWSSARIPYRQVEIFN